MVRRARRILPVPVHEVEVLVVDDATFLLGQRYATEHPELPVRMFRNRVDQGYGGNQKVGYTYAIEHGFNLVAMIHGDGQHAPEELPRLLAPFAEDPDLGAVYGSRILDRGGARRGGMPRYEYVGNRILTTVQNTLLRTDFSEFHSGYRIHDVAALRSIHYRLAPTASTSKDLVVGGHIELLELTDDERNLSDRLTSHEPDPSFGILVLGATVYDAVGP